ncbi:MAG: S41 family peptidase [Pyrinomonadaceae bacterium]
MKRNILFLVALVYLTVASNLVFAQKTAQSEQQVRQKTFEKVWQTINEKYFDPTFGGVDWRAARTAYAPQIAQVKSDAEFYELLNTMLGELKISHMEVWSPETIAKLKTVATTTGLGLREMDNRLVVVTRVLENSSAAKAGIKTGFVIAEIDGEAIKTLDDAKRKLSGAPNTTMRLIYLDENDKRNEAVLERYGLNNSDKGEIGGGISFYALFESRNLANNIGYIRFSNFVAFLNSKIEAAIVSMKDAPGIIIDLRGNGGGDDDVAIKMAGMLFDKETQLMITKTRKGDKFYYKAKPAKNLYLGKVIILVDELSGSASEQFAAGMQEAGRAFIIGKTTAGEDMDADLIKLPTGAFLIYAAGEPHTPKGVIIEGRGVIPNMEVNLTRRQLLTGKDAQLDAAIDYIKTVRP